MAILLSVGMLTACQKPADNNSSADNASKDQTTAAQSTQSQNAEGEHGEHDHEHHEGDGHDHDGHDHEHHEHDGHDHSAHNHAHDENFESYYCANKMVDVVEVIVQDMEGETEARVLIDDIEYDFYPESEKTNNTFVSQDGIHKKPMLMQLGDDTVTFYDYTNKTRGDVILNCQEKTLATAPTAKVQS